MELITTKEIKVYLSKMADECGYAFDKENPFYQNMTRLEALYAHYHVLVEETNTLHTSLKLSEAQKEEVERWLEEFSVSYVQNKAPKVAKLSGAMVKTNAQANEVQL